MVHEKKRCSRARWKMKRNIFELTNEKKTEKLFRFVLFVFVQHHAKLRRAHIERRIYTWCLKHRKSIENNNNHTTEIKKKENCFSVFFLRRFLLLISTCLHITIQRWKKNFFFIQLVNIFVCLTSECDIFVCPLYQTEKYNNFWLLLPLLLYAVGRHSHTQLCASPNPTHSILLWRRYSFEKTVKANIFFNSTVTY